ncbi:MAG: hypothetical protein U0325_15755 [Polyangiales bacterium]
MRTVEGDAHGAGESGDVSLIPIGDGSSQQRALGDGERFWAWTARADLEGLPPLPPPPGEAEIALLLPDCAAAGRPRGAVATRRSCSAPTVYAFAVAFGRDPGNAELTETRARLDASALGVWPARDVLPELPAGMSSGEFIDRHFLGPPRGRR